LQKPSNSEKWFLKLLYYLFTDSSIFFSQAVHKSGVISGAFMNNGAVRCGELICRPISGLFTKNPIPEGYMHVATLPAGASNISITELKNSMNFLGKQ
jgi:hypothetical protein